MHACLLEVDASAGTIEGHFALLATALRADASMHSRTKSFFLSFFTDRTTHKLLAPEIIITREIDCLAGPRKHSENGRSCSGGAVSKAVTVKKGDICGLSRFPNEKNRIKWGCNAIFPQEAWYNMLASQENSKFHLEEDSWLQA
jgi:hypothetical protein